MNPVEFVKAHPVGTTIGVVVVIGVVLLATSGGGTQTVVADSRDISGELAGAAAMQQVQAAYAAKALEISTAKEVALNSNATALTLAQLNKEGALAEMQFAFDKRQAELAAQERMTEHVSTLQAAISTAEIAASRDRDIAYYASIAEQSKSAVTMAQIAASVSTAQSAQQAELARQQAAYAAQVQAAQAATAQAQIASAERVAIENSKPKGLLSWLFG